MSTNTEKLNNILKLVEDEETYPDMKDTIISLFMAIHDSLGHGGDLPDQWKNAKLS